MVSVVPRSSEVMGRRDSEKKKETKSEIKVPKKRNTMFSTKMTNQYFRAHTSLSERYLECFAFFLKVALLPKRKMDPKLFEFIFSQKRSSVMMILKFVLVDFIDLESQNQSVTFELLDLKEYTGTNTQTLLQKFEILKENNIAFLQEVGTRRKPQSYKIVMSEFLQRNLNNKYYTIK